jgi:hypothetical protein
MAAVPVIDADIPIGETQHLYVGSITLDNSYLTGGEPIDAPGNSRFIHLDAQPTAGYVFEFIPASQLLKAYRQKDPAAAGGADIALVEVANAVDLSAVVVRFLAIGA